MGKYLSEEEAKRIIGRFAVKQQSGHFACPRCGKMAMASESVTRNALSRRADVYVCDACGMQEAMEDMMDSRTPLASWAISQTPEHWVVGMKHFTKKEWAQIERETPNYVGKWEASPFNLDRVAAGELPACYIGRRNMLSYEPGVGTVLLTEGVHFTIEEPSTNE